MAELKRSVELSSNDREIVTREEWTECDGKRIRRVFDLDGALLEESLCDSGRRELEKKSLRADGALQGITLFEYADDTDQKYKKMTQLDPEGDIVFIQERGFPPVIGELYRGEKPFMIYPKKTPNQPLQPTPVNRRG